MIEKEIKSLMDGLKGMDEQTVLINNLIYKKSDKTQAFCPYCFEADKKLTRLLKYYLGNTDAYRYDCPVCDKSIFVSFDDEINQDPKDNIPF